MSPDKKYDLIFIDGLHLKEQVMKDIENSLHHLSPGGTIVCHDSFPSEEWLQIVPRQYQGWCGDTWKAIYSLIQNNPEMRIRVYPEDYGLAIIDYHDPEEVNFDLINVEYKDVFNENAGRLMNLCFSL